MGEHLGDALLMLLECLDDLRFGIDNTAAVLDYMDEEGYLDYATHPSLAIAALRFAEARKLEKLYARAFAHCTGMNQQLSLCPEYARVNSTTKSLIRKASTNLDFHLDQATAMLSNFLDDDFSEATLSVSPSIRAHLEKFRGFLVAFYRTSMGEFPLQSFQPRVLRSMREDFEALYNLLADNNWITGQPIPPDSFGEICNLQLVEEFEEKFGFTALLHPLPLIPQFSERPVNGP